MFKLNEFFFSWDRRSARGGPRGLVVVAAMGPVGLVVVAMVFMGTCENEAVMAAELERE